MRVARGVAGDGAEARWDAGSPARARGVCSLLVLVAWDGGSAEIRCWVLGRESWS